MAKILVLGVGNEILTDEGVGIHVIRALQQELWSDDVELLAGGTAGMELLSLIEETDRLIVVDAMDAGNEPGAIFKFTPDDINVIPLQYQISAHQIGLIEVLYLAGSKGRRPETVIFGVQPKEMGWGLGLTPEVAGKIPGIVELVRKEVMKT